MVEDKFKYKPMDSSALQNLSQLTNNIRQTIWGEEMNTTLKEKNKQI